MRPLLVAAFAAATALAAPTYQLDTSFNPLKGTTVERITAAAVVEGNVVVVQRGTAVPFMLAFDHAGAPVNAWGAPPTITSPHGVEAATLGNVDVLWVADIANYTVKAFTPSGQLLGVLGTPGKAGNGTGAGLQFSAPADIAVDPLTGALYVSDGDGGSNNRVAGGMTLGNGYTPAFVVGGEGGAPGQFSSPHSVAWDAVNTAVWVADRGNNRTQVLAGVGHPSAVPGSVLGVWDMGACAGGGQPWGVRVDAARGVVAVADGLTGHLYFFALPTSIDTGAGVHAALGPCVLLQTMPVCPHGSAAAGCTPHEVGLDSDTGEWYLATCGTTGGPTLIQRYTIV